MPTARTLLAGALLAAAGVPAAAQTIYTCVDAQGRRLTADRPIMECLDREQLEYGTGGTVRGRRAPSLTGQERTVQEEKARRAQEEQARAEELRRRDKVLLGRYPDEGSHQRERQASLARVDEAIAAGERRMADLQQQRQQLAADARAAGTDPVKAGRVRRAQDENVQNLDAQRRLLASHVDERQRITARFDEELARLKVLWAQQAPATLPAAAAVRK